MQKRKYYAAMFTVTTLQVVMTFYSATFTGVTDSYDHSYKYSACLPSRKKILGVLGVVLMFLSRKHSEIFPNY